MKIVSCLVFIFLIYLPGFAQNVQEAKLAEEIKMMRKTDQNLRKKWVRLYKKGKTETKKFNKIIRLSQVSDSTNTERMKEIIDQYGWPTYDLVGKTASVNAWLIVQHADRDPLFQMYCLPLLKFAAENGQSDLVNYAFLYDRVQIAKGEKQLYATQSTTNNGINEGYFQPIDDEANVQNRRAEMGFDLHVETYAKELGFNYKIPNQEEAKNRSNEFKLAYTTHIEQARESMKIKDYHDAAEHYLEALKSNGSIKVEDYIEAAKALSLSEHKMSYMGSLFLIKAVIRGYDEYDSFLENVDFDYLKKVHKRNWENLIRVINDLKKY